MGQREQSSIVSNKRHAGNFVRLSKRPPRKLESRPVLELDGLKGTALLFEECFATRKDFNSFE